MSDIVERLRERQKLKHDPDCKEAAAEIDRLLDENERLRGEMGDWRQAAKVFLARAELAEAEIERLNAKVAQLLEISAVEIRKRDDEIERLQVEVDR